jgi:orotate phosphoribosyltransferase
VDTGNDRGDHDDVERLLKARTGHFRFESGHHGDRWFDLETLCLHPEPVRRLAARLAQRLTPHRLEIVCGPLVEGAFVALMVAEELGVPFTYCERSVDPSAEHAHPTRYTLPSGLRAVVQGKRVAIVDDVVNAGSAVGATLADLEACGARPVALGALAVLGDGAARLAAAHHLPLAALATFPSHLWTPDECPLCARGTPLSNAGAR